eukprot:3216518-Pyramimonas_sp.AAC.1
MYWRWRSTRRGSLPVASGQAVRPGRVGAGAFYAFRRGRAVSVVQELRQCRPELRQDDIFT